MWKCLQCGTQNNDERDHCWRCSTTKGAYQAEQLKEKNQGVNSSSVASQHEMVPSSLPLSPGFSPEHIMMLDQRIVQLEKQVQQLEKLATQQQVIITTLRDKLPDTLLLSSRFIERAFTVWGHFTVAHLLLVIPILCLVALLGALGD